MEGTDHESENLQLAEKWCLARGAGWSVIDKIGEGGTAPVYKLRSPDGLRALKLLHEEYSSPTMLSASLRRVEVQCEKIGVNDCPYLVNVYDGGEFNGRIYLLMDVAAGSELAGKLQTVPREKINGIVEQIARACIFLRSKNLCHRDIKSENIYITDDFSHATLLDVSVVREIYDPIGNGTDHGNKLPVVATSRYSPPEYLFRLIEPSETLWHAVDVYQLGCLIYDLVMREQIFEEEFQRSADNRYRFAWIVATQTPAITARDVDAAVILLGERALDKDFNRRSTLNLDDFLLLSENKSKIGLEQIGLAGGAQIARVKGGGLNLRKVTNGHAKNLEEKLCAYLNEKHLRVDHETEQLAEAHSKVSLSWTTKTESFNTVELTYELFAEKITAEIVVHIHARILISDENNRIGDEIRLPQIVVDDEISNVLFSKCVAVISELAGNAMKKRPS